MIKYFFILCFFISNFFTNVNAMLPKNCISEIHKICDLSKKDEVKKCVDEKFNSLSKNCQKEIKVLSFCKQEAEKICNFEDAKINKKEIIKCITNNQSKFPKECKKIFNDIKKRDYSFVKVCKNDIDVFCSDISNRREMFLCLFNKREEVSKICEAAIENVEKKRSEEAKNR